MLLDSKDKIFLIIFELSLKESQFLCYVGYDSIGVDAVGSAPYVRVILAAYLCRPFSTSPLTNSSDFQYLLNNLRTATEQQKLSADTASILFTTNKITYI